MCWDIEEFLVQFATSGWITIMKKEKKKKVFQIASQIMNGNIMNANIMNGNIMNGNIIDAPITWPIPAINYLICWY